MEELDKLESSVEKFCETVDHGFEYSMLKGDLNNYKPGNNEEKIRIKLALAKLESYYNGSFIESISKIEHCLSLCDTEELIAKYQYRLNIAVLFEQVFSFDLDTAKKTEERLRKTKIAPKDLLWLNIASAYVRILESMAINRENEILPCAFKYLNKAVGAVSENCSDETQKSILTHIILYKLLVKYRKGEVRKKGFNHKDLEPLINPGNRKFKIYGEMLGSLASGRDNISDKNKRQYIKDLKVQHRPFRAPELILLLADYAIAFKIREYYKPVEEMLYRHLYNRYMKLKEKVSEHRYLNGIQSALSRRRAQLLALEGPLCSTETTSYFLSAIDKSHYPVKRHRNKGNKYGGGQLLKKLEKEKEVLFVAVSDINRNKDIHSCLSVRGSEIKKMAECNDQEINNEILEMGSGAKAGVILSSMSFWKKVRDMKAGFPIYKSANLERLCRHERIIPVQHDARVIHFIGSCEAGNKRLGLNPDSLLKHIKGSGYDVRYDDSLSGLNVSGSSDVLVILGHGTVKGEIIIGNEIITAEDVAAIDNISGRILLLVCNIAENYTDFITDAPDNIPECLLDKGAVFLTASSKDVKTDRMNRHFDDFISLIKTGSDNFNGDWRHML